MNYNDSEPYCVPGAGEFQRAYGHIHGYVAISICVLGSAANSINIAVLSRREMASATNSILTGLAVADLLVMLEYIPFALHMYISIGPHINRNTYTWAVFIFFHSIFSQVFHTIAIWLTVTLAIWRYIAIAQPHYNRKFTDQKNTKTAIASAYVISPFLCLPIYFAMVIVPLQVDESNNSEFANSIHLPPNRTAYVVQMGDNKSLVKVIFWLYSVLFKLIPCVALCILSTCLISKLSTNDQKHQSLVKKSLVSGEMERLNHNGDSMYNKGRTSRTSRTDRTTRMLLAVLGLFLVTEMPQGLFGLLSAVAPYFFEKCYFMFGDLMDALALLSSGVNFVLYCSMSRQFRATFRRILGNTFASCFPNVQRRDYNEAITFTHKDTHTQTQMTAL